MGPASVEGVNVLTAPNQVTETSPLTYYAAGQGEQRVIFVHGTPGDAGVWEDFLADVPSGFEYMAIDRPGFGQTGGPPLVALSDQAAALKPLMDSNRAPDQPKPILVGFSLGGPIVAQAAIDFPDAVGGLVIIGGAMDPELEKVHPLQPIGETWPIRHLLPKAIRNSNLELMALKPELENLQSKLASLTTPVVIVHGTKDGLVPFANVQFMTEHFPSPQLVDSIIIEGGNHFLPWNSKDKIDLALTKLSAAMSNAAP